MNPSNTVGVPMFQASEGNRGPHRQAGKKTHCSNKKRALIVYVLCLFSRSSPLPFPCRLHFFVCVGGEQFPVGFRPLVNEIFSGTNGNVVVGGIWVYTDGTGQNAERIERLRAGREGCCADKNVSTHSHPCVSQTLPSVHGTAVLNEGVPGAWLALDAIQFYAGQ
jgi:hypothetical protein